MVEGELEAIKALEAKLTQSVEDEKQRWEKKLENAKANRGQIISSCEEKARTETKKLMDDAVAEAERKNASDASEYEKLYKKLSIQSKAKKGEAVDFILKTLGA
ncbi:MAG: hypothetical protein KKD39_08420 [Candidatus Altiarchaeota archaeon]|nr:hypothetical protein [Candidatus Altiarchaeota archaeon]